MPKLDAENFLLELSSGTYLDSLGKVVTSLPSDGYALGTLPFSLDLTEDVKNALKGVTLADIPGVLEDAAPLLEDIGISPQAIEILGACIEIALGFASVVGTVGALVELVNVLGSIFGGGGGADADALSQIYQLNEQINKNLNGLGVQLVQDKVDEFGWANIHPAQFELTRYLKAQHPNKADLQPHLNDLQHAQTNLLDPGFQELPFIAGLFWSQPWSSDISWVDPWFDPGKDTNLPPSWRDLKSLQDGNPRWDYTPYIGAIAILANLLLSYYKALNPAFRTTRQFQDDIEYLANMLEALGNNIARQIFWTREWSYADQYSMPMANGWPVGAVNACTGTSAIVSRWNEGVNSVPGPLHDYYHPPDVLNVDESLARARKARQINWLTVFNASGAPKILQYAAIARELATPPPTSETVKIETSQTAHRKFFQTVKHKTPWFLGCGQDEFDADEYYVQRSVLVHATTQPQRDQEIYTIPYKFYLESWPTILPEGSEHFGSPMDRVEITANGKSATLNGLQFDWEVRELRVARSDSATKVIEKLRADKYVQMAQTRPNLLPIMNPWAQYASKLGTKHPVAFSDPDVPGTMRNQHSGQFTIDCTFSSADGYVEFEFRNSPEMGNFAAVFFVIEEQANIDSKGNSGPIIRTMVDISMVGVELYLPQAYFDYIDLCGKRQSAIVDEINRKHISEKGIPLPSPDPYRYESLGDWVHEVIDQNPSLITGELLRAAKTLPRTASKRQREGKNGVRT
jgi:hypothetical protein